MSHLGGFLDLFLCKCKRGTSLESGASQPIAGYIWHNLAAPFLWDTITGENTVMVADV